MQSRVTPEAIVKNFNVLKNIRFSLRFGLIVAIMMNQLWFQRAKKAFGGDIVVTVTLAAHTTTHLILGQQGLILVAGVLTAPAATLRFSVTLRGIGLLGC